MMAIPYYVFPQYFAYNSSKTFNLVLPFFSNYQNRKDSPLRPQGLTG